MSIAAALRQIQDHKLILPAIQREYVWKPSQVVRVFDSVMRGYPVGSFLSWRVAPETISTFKFYGFMKDYSAFNNRHNPVVDIPTDREVVAVLDGQQRLTSLNIGLRGTYAYKIRGGWSNKAWSYPERRLYLNLLGEAPENELGLKYHFQFLTKEDLEAAVVDDTKTWFPVSEIFNSAEPAAMMQIPAKYGVGNNETAVALVAKLWQEIHHNASLHFYEEDVQDIERVLDIFVRVNSGGTVLSYSDLLLSIATAQWEGDARAAVHGLVDSLNQTGMGFSFSRDTILKSGLVLADVGDIGFKVRNFTTANMAKLEADWDVMTTSLQVAVGLLSDFGLSGGALTADSVLIPVAYYVHTRRLGHSYREYRPKLARTGKLSDPGYFDRSSCAVSGARDWTPCSATCVRSSRIRARRPSLSRPLRRRWRCAASRSWSRMRSSKTSSPWNTARPAPLPSSPHCSRTSTHATCSMSTTYSLRRASTRRNWLLKRLTTEAPSSRLST